MRTKSILTEAKQISRAVALIGLLAAHAVRGPGAVLERPAADNPDGFGLLGPFLAAAVMAAYVMYGFDTAGTLAEAVRDGVDGLTCAPGDVQDLLRVLLAG